MSSVSVFLVFLFMEEGMKSSLLCDLYSESTVYGLYYNNYTLKTASFSRLQVYGPSPTPSIHLIPPPPPTFPNTRTQLAP